MGKSQRQTESVGAARSSSLRISSREILPSPSLSILCVTLLVTRARSLGEFCAGGEGGEGGEGGSELSQPEYRYR